MERALRKRDEMKYKRATSNFLIRKKVLRLSVFLVGLLFLTESAFAETQSMPACLELLQNRCQSCHYLNRVCQKLEEKSKRRWAATLKRMVKRRGANLSGEEQDFLLDCLATPAPDIKQECGK